MFMVEFKIVKWNETMQIQNQCMQILAMYLQIETHAKDR